MDKLSEIKRYKKDGFIGLDTIGLRYIDWLIEEVEKVACLEKELEEMTDERNTWRSNSLDWNGEED